jgi:hypothetical protein
MTGGSGKNAPVTRDQAETTSTNRVFRRPQFFYFEERWRLNFDQVPSPGNLYMGLKTKW